MAASATLLSMAHERKVENLRAFMVKLANSRGFLLPDTKLFEQKLLDLCLSRTPDHPTYSAMIFLAIKELNEEGGSCEEKISEFIMSKYKNLPFAHKSLLSHHLAKLVEKKEILCDCNNCCYSFPGETKTEKKKKKTVASTGTVNEVRTRQNRKETGRILKSWRHKVDTLEEPNLTEAKTIPKRKACGGINAIEVRHAFETLRKGLAIDPELALVKNEIEGRIEVNTEGGELYDVVILEEKNDVVMEESGKPKSRRTSNTMKEANVEVKSEACKTLWENQTEACSNIIALEKLLKQCREKDQQNKDVSEIDDVSPLPLSMESCKELRKLAQKIERQLSEVIDSCDESTGCEIVDAINGFHFKESQKNTPSGHQLEQQERQIDCPKKPPVKKTRFKRRRDIETTVLRKSPRAHKPV